MHKNRGFSLSFFIGGSLDLEDTSNHHNSSSPRYHSPPLYQQLRIPQSTGGLINHRLLRNRLTSTSTSTTSHQTWSDFLTKGLNFNRPIITRENLNVPSESLLPKQASLFDTFKETKDTDECIRDLPYFISLDSTDHQGRSRAETILVPSLPRGSNRLPTINESSSALEDSILLDTDKPDNGSVRSFTTADQGDEYLQSNTGSSVSQTIFNSINLFVGVGLLSLPFTFKSGGWILGSLLLIFGAILSRYMLKLLLKAMDAVGAQTYSDLGEITYGTKGRWIITAFLFAELFSCGCAYIVLVGDTLHDIVGKSSQEWWTNKIILKSAAFIFVMLPSTLVGSLRALSVGSSIGIFGSLMLGVVMLIDAISKPSAPGSIWEPAQTEFYPSSLKSWLMAPLSLGLVMYNYSGGAVIPNLYRDMREPEKITKVLNITFILVTLWFMSMSVLGYWMFGIDTKEEIIFNISLEPFYNKILTKVLLWLIVLNPLTKFSLLLNPVCKNLELSIIRPFFISMQNDLDNEHDEDKKEDSPILPPPSPLSNEITFPSHSPHEDTIPLQRSTKDEISRAQIAQFYAVTCIIMRGMIATLAFIVGVTYPNFNDILAFIGTFFSFSVSAIFPCLVYLKIFRGNLSTGERIGIFMVLLISSFMVISGFIWKPLLSLLL